MRAQRAREGLYRGVHCSRSETSHDIGNLQNIVRMLLENYGLAAIDWDETPQGGEIQEPTACALRAVVGPHDRNGTRHG